MTCIKCGDEIVNKIGCWRVCRKCFNCYQRGKMKNRRSEMSDNDRKLYAQIIKLNRAHENGCDKHKDCFTCPFEDCIA